MFLHKYKIALNNVITLCPAPLQWAESRAVVRGWFYGFKLPPKLWRKNFHHVCSQNVIKNVVKYAPKCTISKQKIPTPAHGHFPPPHIEPLPPKWNSWLLLWLSGLSYFAQCTQTRRVRMLVQPMWDNYYCHLSIWTITTRLTTRLCLTYYDSWQKHCYSFRHQKPFLHMLCATKNFKTHFWPTV